jgi:hypothetical protein
MPRLPFEPRSFPRLHRALKKIVGYRRLLFDLIRRLPAPFSLGLPRGSYSDLALLQTVPPSLPGRLVLSDQGSPPTGPDRLVVLSRRGEATEQPWPIFWTHHHDVELIGPSLAHVNGKGQLCEESVYGPVRAQTDPAYFYRRGLHPVVALPGNWTSLVSLWMSTVKPQPYWHWLMEALPRLAFLPEFPADTRIIVPPSRLPFQLDSLKMLGLLDRCRLTSEQHLRIEDYYFSPPQTMIACYNPYSVEWLRRTFLPLIARTPPVSTPKRFFIRRTGSRRNIVNEEAVFDFFRGLGWEIVDTAEISFPEQVRLFSQAEAISGIHGSSFANLVWCNPACKVLELFCEDYICAGGEWIAHCIPPLQHHYLLFPGDHRLNARVDLRTLKEALEKHGMLEGD